MARDFQSINIAVWNDPDFRRLPPPAQHLYFMLCTSPNLTYCGVHDWRPARLTGRSSGLTTADVETVAACLQARHFLVVDEGTEEALVRSWARWDGLLAKPRLAVSYVKAYRATASSVLRSVLVHELHKAQVISPEFAAFKDSRVLALLDEPRQSAKELDVPEDPFADGFEYRFEEHFEKRLEQTPTGVCEAFEMPLHPAPSTSTLSPHTTQNPAAHETSPTERQDVSPADADGVDRFEEFWGVYAKKSDRKGAEQKWRLALRKPGVTADLLIDRARTYRAGIRDPQYVMEARKWLLGERWNDEADTRSGPHPDRLPDGRINRLPTPDEQAEFGDPPDGTVEEYDAWWARTWGRYAS